MTERYKTKDILDAINIILNKKETVSSANFKDKNENTLKLTNEVKDIKKDFSNVPKETEQIILEAEKYLKK